MKINDVLRVSLARMARANDFAGRSKAHLHATFLAALFLALMAGSASAQIYSMGDGEWSSTSVFNPTPTSSDSVGIGGNNVTIGSATDPTDAAQAESLDMATSSLTLEGSGSLQIGGFDLNSGSTFTVLGGTLTVSDYLLAVSSSALVLGNGVTIGASAPIRLDAVASNFSITVATGTATMADTISNFTSAGGFAKLGAGTLVLSGTNSYSGGTTVSNGTLIIGNNHALGTGTVTVSDGAAIGYYYSAGPTLSNNLSLSGTIGVVVTGGGFGGEMTANGTTTLTGDTTVAIQSGAHLFLSDIQQSSPGTSLALSGAGVGTLNGSDYVSQTIIGSGSVLVLNDSNQNSTILNNLTIQNGGYVREIYENQLGANAVVTVNGNFSFYRAETISNLQGAGFVVSESVGGFGIPSILTIDQGNFSGQIEDFSMLTDVTSLTKASTGLLTLSGSNTYTGGTTINGGILEISSENNIGGSGNAGGLTFGGGELLVTNTSTFTEGITLDAGTNTLATTTGSTTTYSGLITGSGSLTIGDGTNAGTVALTHANNYSGGTTLVSGTLVIGNSSALGTGAVTTIDPTMVYVNGDNIANPIIMEGDTTLEVDNTDSATQSGTVSESGGSYAITKTGSGTLNLTGANSYSGGTTISAGTLEASNDSALGTGGLTINASGTLEVNTSGLTVSDLSGAGAINLLPNTAFAITNTGTDTFSGTLEGNPVASSPFSLPLFGEVGGGTLKMTGTTTLYGQIAALNGTIEFDSASSLSNNTFLLVTAGSNIVVNGVDLATAGLGTFGLGSDGNVILNGGSLTVELPTGVSSASDSFAGNISGSGGFGVNGAGTTQTLSGTDTYSGATIITSGTLVAGSTTALSHNSAFTVNGTLDLGGFSNHIASLSGTGTITNSGGSGQNATLVIYPSTYVSTTFGGVIQDGAHATIALDVAGGELTLTGSNTYSGGTTLNAGTLVAANASALGKGVVNQSGGTLETDNVNHVITMGNGFDQTAGTLVLNLNGAPNAASNDVVNVTGSAALGGNLTINYTAGKIAPLQSETYTVITTTTGITSVNVAGYEPPALQAGALLITITGEKDSLNPDNFDVTLTGKQTGFTALAGTNFTGNQQSVASYLDRFDTSPTLSGPVISLLQALDGVSVNPSALGPYLDQLTPLKFANFTRSTAFNNASFSTQAFDNYLANHRGADGTFIGSNGGIDYSGLTVNNPNVDSGLQTVYSRLLAWNPGPSTGFLSDTPAMDLGGIAMKDTKPLVETSETPANPWNVFVSGNVVLAQDFSDSAAGTSHADSTTGAVQAGADYKITPHLLVGAEFAYGHTSATLDNIGSNASVDTYSPGVYASYSDKGWYANALGSYGFANYNQNRNVAIGAFNGTASSHPGGDQIVGDLDGGYDFHRGPWTFGPTLGLQYVHLDVDGYTETGLPGANLAVNQAETDSLRSGVGGRISYAIRDGGVLFNPHLSASWQHEFLDQSRGITSQFNGIGAGSFVVATPNPSRDSALVDVGLDAQVNNALTVFTDYSVQAGQSNYFGQSVQAGVKIGF